ncbi:MAG: glycosyltransferase family 9 protein [Thermoanaerobaculum sp.]
MSRFPCRLLLDLPNWLGDWVHALPAIEILLAANRHGETAFLLPAGHAPLARLYPAKTVVRPPKASSGFGRKLSGFDVALTFRHSTRAKLLLAAVRKAEGWASAGRGANFLGLHTFPVDRARHQRHDFDHALVALGLLPVDGQPVRLRFPPVADKAQHLVVLLPGSLGPPAKRYPPSGYRDLGRKLKAAGFEVLVVVGPGDASLGHWLARESKAQLFPPDAGLWEVAQVLARARLVIGNDSGLTHLAAALGCAAVFLFGPTSPARTAPSQGLVLQAPDFPHRGWEGLPARFVFHACERLLAGDLQGARFMSTITAGGGPLAQLAEQGTLNP